LRKGLLEARLMLIPPGGERRPVVVVDIGIVVADDKTDEHAVTR
jgi:hypothetical protein